MVAVWNSKGKGFFALKIQRHWGVSYDWNSEGMEEEGVGDSRGDILECESTNELTTPLTTMKSKIPHIKHLIDHAHA